jgi:hypothetical protein
MVEQYSHRLTGNPDKWIEFDAVRRAGNQVQPHQYVPIKP